MYICLWGELNMRLTIDNIGKIKHADIEMNGITVIAGDNNTGKSTVGKALYCIFNSCYNIESYIDHQKAARLNTEIGDILRSHVVIDIEKENHEYELFDLFLRIRFKNVKPLIKKVTSAEDKKTHIYEYLYQEYPKEIIDKLDSINDVCEEILGAIDNLKNIPTKKHRISRVHNYFNIVFDRQVVNIFSDSGSVAAYIKEGTFKAEFDKDGCRDIYVDFIFNNNATLIDNPDIFNNYPLDKTAANFGIYPIGDLIRKINRENKSDSVDIDTTLVADKLSKVYEILNRAVKGKFLKSSIQNSESFLFDGMSQPIKLHNLSTGVKSFLTIKRLCENGVLVKKGVLILDEPEVHLHPDWQLLYAEAIVLLQKEFDLTVLITSHSPTFVRAIECYCDIYDRMDILDVYKTRSVNQYNYTLDNISYSEYGISELYEDFTAPFSELESMIDEKYENEEED